MKFAAITSFVLATAAVASAVSLPAEHHSRFLAERPSLEEELAAWKDSEAGRVAREQGFYKPQTNRMSTMDDESVKNDELMRLFLTKVTIEEAQQANPKATFGLNTPFTLMTNEEFAAYVGRSSANGSSHGVLRGLSDEAVEVTEAAEAAEALPAAVDWTKSSRCVPPVKNQGKCGSCWAFGGVASLEFAYCKARGKQVLFSEQQAVSCDTNSSGCDGGWPENVHKLARRGMCTQDAYPYISGTTKQSEECKYNSCTPEQFTVTAINRVSASENSYLTAIAKQPITVIVAAGNPSWKQYTGGVISSCSTTKLDHAVLAVGYDATSYKIKNSWGSSWGMSGYLQLERQGAYTGACEILNGRAVYPIVA